MNIWKRIMKSRLIRGYTICHEFRQSTELQIRGGNEDNSRIIFLISQQKHVMTPHKNRLDQMVQMMGHKYVLKEKCGKLCINCLFYPFLSGWFRIYEYTSRESNSKFARNAITHYHNCLPCLVVLTRLNNLIFFMIMQD